MGFNPRMGKWAFMGRFILNAINIYEYTKNNVVAFPLFSTYLDF